MKTKVVFVHGWGMSPNIWQGIASSLDNIDPYFIDLGFLKTKGNPQADLTGIIPKGSIVVGHSLGALWLLKNANLSQIKGFVSISGFDSFNHHLPAELKPQMKLLYHRLGVQPLRAMRMFWWLCESSTQCETTGELNIHHLMEGFSWISTWDARENLRSLTCPIMALATKDDRIVPLSMSKSIWKNHDLRIHLRGGHMVMEHEPSWCVEQLQDFIDKV